MELLLIRHGQSEADLLEVHEGRADYPLTELGEIQALKMAQHVSANYPPDVIISSPLIRARKTSEILQQVIKCEIHIEEDLMEFNNGVLAGVPKHVALVKYPLPKEGRPLHIPIQEGESDLQFRYRSERVLHKIMYDYRECERVAIVSHGGLISNLLNALLNQPVNSCYVFPTGDTGIHLLDIKENVRVVKFLNNQEHLRELSLEI